MTVAVSDLLLQFPRGHHEFHVTVAPAHDPDDWYAFGEAPDLANDIGATIGSAGNCQMSDFERLFTANIEGLKLPFSHPQYIRTTRRRQDISGVFSTTRLESQQSFETRARPRGRSRTLSRQDGYRSDALPSAIKVEASTYVAHSLPS